MSLNQNYSPCRRCTRLTNHNAAQLCQSCRKIQCKRCMKVVLSRYLGQTHCGHCRTIRNKQE